MLEVKSPWNSKTIGTVNTCNQEEIEIALNTATNVSKLKGSDFSPLKRIEILKNFCKKINENIEDLAKLATSEGGKPITDSIVEIKRGAEGVDSCIEVLKSEAGSVIPMNLNETSSNRIAFTQRTNRCCFGNKRIQSSIQSNYPSNHSCYCNWLFSYCKTCRGHLFLVKR